MVINGLMQRKTIPALHPRHEGRGFAAAKDKFQFNYNNDIILM